MGNIGETPGRKVQRIGKEKQMREYSAAGDMHNVDRILDTYPYGTRSPISLEQAHAIAGSAIRNAERVTESHEVITQTMLDAESEF